MRFNTWRVFNLENSGKSSHVVISHIWVEVWIPQLFFSGKITKLRGPLGTSPLVWSCTRVFDFKKKKEKRGPLSRWLCRCYGMPRTKMCWSLQYYPVQRHRPHHRLQYRLEPPPGLPTSSETFCSPCLHQLTLGTTHQLLFAYSRHRCFGGTCVGACRKIYKSKIRCTVTWCGK